jgi:CheY-like chemotaxis protein
MANADPGSVTQPRPPRVLLIDDSAEGRHALARYLELNGFNVSESADGASALAAMHTEPPPDIVLTDMILPDVDGREICRQARLLNPRPIVALITGWVFDPEADDLRELEVDLLLYKPLDVKDLIQKLRDVSPRLRSDDSPG